MEHEHRSTWDEDTSKLTSFSSGDKLYAFIRGFYGLKGLPNFFTKQMYSFFQELIDQGFALVYIDDILLLSHSKSHMLQLIEQLHQICTKQNLKIAPEKSFFMLLTVKFLGHEIGNQTIKPIYSKVDAIHNLKTPQNKRELMRFVGSMNFYSKFIHNLHINLKHSSSWRCNFQMVSWTWRTVQKNLTFSCSQCWTRNS